MKHGSLFSGIGGFDQAAQWMGWKNVFHCEWNEFGQKVLKHYWPKAISYNDITTTDFTIHRGKIDILTGGVPCQPYSQAGKRLGKEDERHLWPHMLRAIREIQPTYVVAENVRGLVNWNGGMVFNEVQVDLEAAGYEVTPFLLPAAGVNAPHRRDRIWFVAYRKSGGYIQPQESDGWAEYQQDNRKEIRDTITTNGSWELTTNPNGERSKERNVPGKPIKQKFINSRNNEYGNDWQNFPTQPPICGGDDGLPRKMDGITFPKWRNESIKAYGNAIVPQVALQIFQAIQLTQCSPPPNSTTSQPTHHSEQHRNGLLNSGLTSIALNG